LFKPYFAQGLVTKGDVLDISSFSSGPVGKYAALYGLEDLFETLPETLEQISMSNRAGDNVIIDIPPSITRFKNLEFLACFNCIRSVPQEICELKNLNFISLINNSELQEIPECIGEMESIVVVNLRGSNNVKVPENFKTRAQDMGDNIWDFQSESN